ncbi:MFS transporter [Dermatobacter hominis]|uniref:MFS transporter n=1 Tax=Dermatobacter hominis TaxID=2884263 RepID=UPI001D1149ED|nr:MFS transporter [Dermatobacter hominis]UDY37583.1 MFS transporter [Dermatobacter hominis]
MSAEAAVPVDVDRSSDTPPEFARRNLILAVMCLALVMVVSGVSMITNALPHLAAGIGASQSDQQWIIDAYGLTLAALLLPAGALGDRYGRRGALIAGVAVFGTTALLSVWVDTPTQLIALRAAMGIGAALIMPGTLSTITSVFPPEERPKAVGIWAGFAGAGGTLGILMSGALLERFSWSSIFVVTAALAVVTLIGVVLVVPSTRASEHVGLDPAGTVLSAVGIGALVFGIIEGPVKGWSSATTLTGLIAGVVLVVAFLVVELRTEHPLLDPRLFRFRGFATGSASLFLQFFAMFGFFFVALQFLQLVLGYSTFVAALALMPMTAVMLPLSSVSGTLSERYGHKLVGGAGLAISAVGFAMFAAVGRSDSYWGFLVSTVIVGAGAALAMTPATNAIVASLPRSKQGVASAVNDTARELGAAFGVAVLGSAFNVGYRDDIAGDLGGLTSEVARQAREAPAIALQIADAAGDSALADAARHAFSSGMRYATLLGAALLLFGAVFVWVRGDSVEDEAEEDALDRPEDGSGDDHAAQADASQVSA